MCFLGVLVRGAAGDARAKYGRDAGEIAHAAPGRGPENVHDPMLDHHVGAVVQRADAEGARGLGLGEGKGEFLQPLGVDMAGGVVEPGLGLAATAEQDGKEGEEEGAQDVVQAQFSRRAFGAGTGRALRPTGRNDLHFVSLCHLYYPLQIFSDYQGAHGG